MSTPSNTADNGAAQHASASSSADPDDENMNDIPRRLMRVKVLYTFDDQNKSNCLARLPNALSIPTVALDETTQVGVIELKTCIQAIVGASPELVAKLGHDYTVYAYDYSEYETPLVGQGMLSWILSSASTTPTAPAEESQTMVTGRVCKNIMGLFSNGIKETLEVKLKLVPVPTCMQKEYVENMERYHNLSKLVPEGLDYNAWAEFLKANPAIGQLAQPTQEYDSRTTIDYRSPIGGVEPFHHMLSRPGSSQDIVRNESFQDQPSMPFNTQQTRASSPAMSTISLHHYQYSHDSRPASRASCRSDAAHTPRQYPPTPGTMQDQQEEGPPKKRARITKAKRPKKTVLNANNESLRVTASTAASVRLHRPIASNHGTAFASIEQVPRAPTPRPGDTLPFVRPTPRPPAPSLLRQGSTDEGRPYMSPYDTPGVFSDNAMDSADDERGGSPGDTPMDIPSSPPLIPQRMASSAPSSPGLPALSFPADSGFVSDIPLDRDESEMDASNKLWDGSDLPTAPEVKVRPKQDRSHHAWQAVNPGPVELLPKSYVPKPKTYPRPRPMQSIVENQEPKVENVPTDMNSIDEQLVRSFQAPPAQSNDLSSHFMNGPTDLAGKDQARSCSTMSPPADSASFGPVCPDQYQSFSQPTPNNAGSPPFPGSFNEAHPMSRSATPNPQPQQAKPTKSRGLPRSQTWSGGEPMSDAVAPGEGKQPRSGSGAKRKQHIKERMEAAIAAGEMPIHCNNCGEIETPTWRKSYTRIENGSPTDVKLSCEGTGIVAYEVMPPTEDISEPRYRIFKQALTPEEKASDIYETFTLCNPCGLWLTKKGSMRPQSAWEKAQQAKDDNKPKRKRNPPKGSRKKVKEQNDDMTSDAIVPHSEPVMPSENRDARTSFDGSADSKMPPPPMRERASSFQASQLDDETAQAALRRAIQSSPAGFRGSRDSPIDIEPDLTPKPTRRLLFPSPRKAGEVKSLADSRTSPTGKASAPKTSAPTLSLPRMDIEDIDKENCPPLAIDEDDLAHLFEDNISPKTTPTKGQGRSLEDLLKTPTPGSRRRSPTTPKRSAEKAGILTTPSRNIPTPSRNILTPRANVRAATIGPETPFTKQLNALLTEYNPLSPSQAFDFSAFPTFNTPGRNSGAQFTDFLPDDFLSSDLPIPSSSPGGSGSNSGLSFALYEDPNTATVGIWSGASIFEGSDAIVPDLDITTLDENEESQQKSASKSPKGTEAVMRLDGISVDFAAMIESVVSGNKSPEPESRRGSHTDSQIKVEGQTPEVQAGAE